MSLKLKDRVAIVAGAGAIGEGMSNGRAAALSYAREGAKVLAVDRDLASVSETQRQIREEGGTCEIFVADLTDSKSTSEMVEFCLQALGGTIDILHNNIGILASGGPVEHSEEDWDRVVTVNLKTMFLTSKYVIPVMEKQKRGVITNIGSMAGLRYTGLPFVAYATTKGAVPAFTRTIAMQYAGVGIRANVIHPGVVDTPMQRATTDAGYGAVFGNVDADALRKKREATIPLGRYGTPFDIAQAAVFLASDDASYITGVELMVDGGFISRAG
ncbi:SDR family NAD(P)-dependent oxidoreductase [Cupriavidus sp. UYPR2.512]|uniref:SDR family NAD(P)-dependent oxidoreductase n=1 Tax=Cupriavidus sp. UYPR2.512 TaxID=1080187 RepID=UPI0003635142|nr:SDR family oxidoreductase [Cupriavidus sp. UYPR2.512]UIF90008.1 SDR family oxidoreductase [Cupriavidus necator]